MVSRERSPTIVADEKIQVAQSDAKLGLENAGPKAVTIDHYEVRRKLAKGGMGAIYVGYEKALDREVALKFLDLSLCHDKCIVERFDLEAKAAADLKHPNIVSVYFRGRAGGRPYFAMELIEGQSLAEVVQDDLLTALEAADYLLQTAQGLQAAWRKKRLHRDIKPANLMVTKDGLVKITDFGLMKALDADKGLTSGNIVVGTPNFISPEQAQGNKVDCRSDMYSLGATFYYLLTGSLPFEGETAMGVMVKHINQALPPLRLKRDDIPPAMANTIERLMAKRPEERFLNYEELIEHLQALKKKLSKSPSSSNDTTAQPIPAKPTEPGPVLVVEPTPTPLSMEAPVIKGPASSSTLGTVVSIFFLLLLTAAISVGLFFLHKQQKEEQLVLSLKLLPPPATAGDSERSLDALRGRITGKPKLHHVRALTALARAFINLDGAQERLVKFKPADGQLHALAASLRSSGHLSLESIDFSLIDQLFSLFDGLAIDFSPFLNLFQHQCNVEVGVLYFLLRYPSRPTNFLALKATVKDVITTPTIEPKWRRHAVEELTRTIPEDVPSDHQQLRQSYALLVNILALAQVDPRKFEKRFLRLRQERADRSTEYQWDAIENGTAHLLLAALQVLPRCKPNTRCLTEGIRWFRMLMLQMDRAYFPDQALEGAAFIRKSYFRFIAISKKYGLPKPWLLPLNPPNKVARHGAIEPFISFFDSLPELEPKSVQKVEPSRFTKKL